jgi:hypothetical protein
LGFKAKLGRREEGREEKGFAFLERGNKKNEFKHEFEFNKQNNASV